MEETHQIKNGAGGHNTIRRAAFLLLCLGLSLLAIFFVPAQGVSVLVAKTLLISSVALIAFVAFIILTIQEGKVLFPRNLLTLSALLVPVTFLVSAIFKGGGVMSYFGYGFEMGTVSSSAVLFLLFFVTSQIIRGTKKMTTLYGGLVVSFFLVSLFEIVHIASVGKILNFGLFPLTTSNPIGNWNDLGIFFAIFTLLSLSALQILAPKKIAKLVLCSVFVLSLLALAVVNFSTLWIVLAVFSAMFFLYVYSFDRFQSGANSEGGMQKRTVSLLALSVCVLSVVFILFGQGIGNSISNKLQTVNIEVRPSWTTTASVVVGSLKDSPVFGTAPNTFGVDWLLHKPVGVNESVFWNTDFTSGIGLIPTYVATTGILGILAWLFFFVIFIWCGIRALFFSTNDIRAKYFLTSSFLISSFLWVMCIVYVPSIVTVGLAFLFTGIFCASLYEARLIKEKEVTFSHHPKLSFVVVLLLIALLIGAITFLYVVVQKNLSQIYFQSSVLTYQKDGDLLKAEQSIGRAIAIEGYDTYYRGISEINLIRVDDLLKQTKLSQKEVQDGFQMYIANSIQNAQKAIAVNPSNYQNHLALAQVYGALVPKPFEIPGAYENAQVTFEKALNVNPHNPTILLGLARLQVAKGDLKSARDFVNRAIAEKQNYADAHFLLAQIEVTEGKLAPAISSLETTIVLTPSNPGLLFQLGLLKYSNKDFVGSADAFEKSIALVPEYANAKYFLGLSYVELGRNADAITQFTQLVATNPDNAEIKLILENLTAGRGPFANAKAPITNKPEKRKELPLKQTN